MHNCHYTTWIVNNCLLLVLAQTRDREVSRWFYIDTAAGMLYKSVDEISLPVITNLTGLPTNRLHPWYRAQLRAYMSRSVFGVEEPRNWRVTAPAWLAKRTVSGREYRP